ncbi:hypothetical protein KNJ79_05360 [Sphingopyxis indica]|uniref:hypothetical protein n=1 Tax=Sphingopyxis indica TaxID=436663 RepID=UPI0029394C0B|nr:hypothetical protein [Sphingopyxis indica]WOF44361.1 hypothetical protein KNJ79_05360 [Sphingopyxis indica]
MADVRLRLFFNFSSGKSHAQVTRRQLDAAASTIIQNVAVSYAEREKEYFFNHLSRTVRTDVFREITNVADRYRRLIIGKSRGPGTAIIDSAAEHGPSANLHGLSWTPRRENYLRRKRRELGHTRWWQGWTGHMSDVLAKGQNWVEIFGPIRVAFTPGKSRDFRLRTINFGLRQSEARVHIGTLNVTALERVTPAMIAAGTKRGIPAAIAAAGYEELAYRVGGPAEYRQTLEPFLSFVLTRAIPYAVRRRVEAGLHKPIR